jgi:hypothetical protein
MVRGMTKVFGMEAGDVVHRSCLAVGLTRVWVDREGSA